MANLPSYPQISIKSWINGVTKLNHINMTAGINANLSALHNVVNSIIDALGGPGADVDSNYMSLAKGGYVNLAEAPEHAYDIYFGAHYGTSSYLNLSDQQFGVKTTRNGVAMVFTMNGSNDHIAQFTRIDQSTNPATVSATKVPFKSGNHTLVLDDDLDEANAKITALETKTAKQESDIQYLYRQVIGGGDLVTATDSGVALTSQPFPLTVSPKTLLDYVGGMCQKVNQFRATNSVSGSESASAAYSNIGKVSTPLTYGHKYFVSVETKDASDNVDVSGYKFKLGDGAYEQFSMNISNSSSWQKSEKIAELTLGNGTNYQYSFFQHGNNTNLLSIEWRNLRIVDITNCWPTDTPTSTSDARIQWLMSYLSSHPEYNAGSIITAPVTMVVSKGFNQWDETTMMWNASLSVSTGATYDNPNAFTSGYVSVKELTEYYLYAGTGSTICYVCYYDKDKHFISGDGWNKNTVKATPSNCKYLRFSVQQYGTTYNHDICINVSNASLNGTYMPYRAPIEYPIPAEVQALDGYGYGLSAECYNYVDFDGKKNVKMVARVDLGTLNYTSINDGVMQTYVTDIKPTANSRVANVICANYEPHSANGVYNKTYDKSVAVNSSGALQIYDSAYTDATAFKQAMSGVYLYYELATPTETDISEYIDSDVIEVSAGGHLEFENEDDMGVPYSATYQCDSADSRRSAISDADIDSLFN